MFKLPSSKLWSGGVIHVSNVDSAVIHIYCSLLARQAKLDGLIRRSSMYNLGAVGGPEVRKKNEKGERKKRIIRSIKGDRNQTKKKGSETITLCEH
jgi:hypothetical protein